jgi:hypothetical protein
LRFCIRKQRKYYIKQIPTLKVPQKRTVPHTEPAQSNIKLILWQVHCEKRLAIFPSPDGMSLTKLSLAKESLVCAFSAGDGKIANIFLQCSVHSSKKDAKNDIPLETPCDIVPLLIFNLEQHTKKPRDERGAGECGSRHLKWFIHSTSHPSPLVLGSWGE